MAQLSADMFSLLPAFRLQSAKVQPPPPPPATTTLLLPWLTAAVIALVSLYAAYLFFLPTRRRDNSFFFASQHGCQPIRNRFPRPSPPPQAQDFKSFFTFLAECHQRLGLTVEAGASSSSRVIHTIDPENIKALLSLRAGDFRPAAGGSTDDHHFSSPLQSRLLGRGILAVADADEAARSRAHLRPHLVKDTVVSADVLTRHVSSLLGRIPCGEAVDPAPLLRRLILDTAVHFLFGPAAGSSNSKYESFASALDTVFAQIARQKSLPPPWSASHGRERDDTERAEEALRVVRRYVDDLVQKSYAAAAVTAKTSAASSSSSSSASASASTTTVLDSSWSSVSEDEVIKDDEQKPKGAKNGHQKKQQILVPLVDRLVVSMDHDPAGVRDELINLLFMGRDAVCNLLVHLLHALARDPAAWKKLREEALQQQDESAESQSAAQSSYARSCVSEALRLFPPVPYGARIAVRDTLLPLGGGTFGEDPVHIRRGDLVVHNLCAMHRCRDFFGDDADEFRPERWENNRFSWEYLPFGGGPRTCLGQQFALDQVTHVLACFAREFSAVEAVAVAVTSASSSRSSSASKDLGLGLGLGLGAAEGLKVAFLK